MVELYCGATIGYDPRHDAPLAGFKEEGEGEDAAPHAVVPGSVNARRAAARHPALVCDLGRLGHLHQVMTQPIPRR